MPVMYPMRPKMKPFAFILIILLLGGLAAGNFYMLHYAPFGACTINAPTSDMSSMTRGLSELSACINYNYYFLGAPLLVGLLLLLTLPKLITGEGSVQEEKPPQVITEPRKAAPPPKPTTDAAVQFLGLLQREGRLVDFLREDIQPYDDAQIGALRRPAHGRRRRQRARDFTRARRAHRRLLTSGRPGEPRGCGRRTSARGASTTPLR